MWRFVFFFLFCQFSHAQVEKVNAFTVLEEKCNVCHKIEKPETVFTIENMDGYARQINRQVFLFKIMPKGNEITLDDKERKALKDWIRWVKSSHK